MTQFKITMCAMLAICAPLPIFAQAPTSLPSSSKLTEDAGKSDSWTYRKPNVSFAQYKRFIIQPTVIYDGPAAQWSSTDKEQRQKFANYLTSALREEIGKGYALTDKPGADVATMRLTLLGVQGTTTVAATASRVTPFGLALSGVKSLTGKPGSFTGSVHAAFELTDSRTGELQFAAVRRRSPDALDIEATLSTDSTVQAVADDIAKTIRKALDKANGVQSTR